jgi:pyrroline-5-carboxylate reductase
MEKSGSLVAATWPVPSLAACAGKAAAEQFIVVEPFAPQREKLLADFGIAALEQPSRTLAQAVQIVWAVKPQTFREAAAQALRTPQARCI